MPRTMLSMPKLLNHEQSALIENPRCLGNFWNIVLHNVQQCRMHTFNIMLGVTI